MKKLFVVALAAVCLVACNKPGGGEEPEVYDNSEVASLATLTLSEDGLMAEAMSANHKYVVGTTPEYVPFVWNVETNTLSSFQVNGGLHGVNNAGVAVGATNEENSQAIIVKNGELSYLQAPETAFGSSAWAVSEDGEVAVGYYFDANYKTQPCYWDATGNYHNLPVPTENEVGFEVDGAAARWMSADGSVVLGYLVDNFGTWPLTLWRRQGGEYVCDPICKDYFEDDYQKGKPYMVFGSNGNAMAISANGKWIAFSVQAEYDPFNWDVEPDPAKGARMNLDTKKMELVEDVFIMSAISNNGTVLAYDEGTPTDRNGFIWLPGETQAKNLATYYQNVSGMQGLFSCSPMSIAPDNSAIGGYLFNDTDNFHSFVLSK